MDVRRHRCRVEPYRLAGIVTNAGEGVVLDQYNTADRGAILKMDGIPARIHPVPA
jgi:hypothetical protein